MGYICFLIFFLYLFLIRFHVQQDLKKVHHSLDQVCILHSVKFQGDGPSWISL